MLFDRRFWIVVNEPAMNTREPTTSMSQISPLLIRGMSVRGVSGTSAVWLGAPGLAVGAVGLTERVVWAVVVPSLTVRVTVFAPVVV